MKTIRQLEPSDIDPKDKFNESLAALLGISALLWSSMRDKSTDEIIQYIVASFLNGADAMGISVSRKESIPAPFKSAFPDGTH